MNSSRVKEKREHADNERGEYDVNYRHFISV